MRIVYDKVPQSAFPGSVPCDQSELPIVQPEGGVKMKPLVCLIQPPFTQLNSPYPSLYYLQVFLEQQGYTVMVRDHSIGLFEKIFCEEGLTRIFRDARKTFDAGALPDRQSGPVVERFFSEEGRWLASIDRLIAFLRGRDCEWGHLLGLANGVLPGGPRFDFCLAELCAARGDVSSSDASLLASRLLADIADFITVTLDPGFSLIRYVPFVPDAAGAGFLDFAGLCPAVEGYITRNFYQPFLETEWNYLEKTSGEGRMASPPVLLGLSIPFPGCLAGALACAESAKARFGGRVITLAGGGYVNTELRFIEEEKTFDYFDYLSFDRGFGSLDAILKREAENGCKSDAPLYKTMYHSKNGSIIQDKSIAGIAHNETPETVTGKRIDDEAARSVFPDYSGVDFSRYICPVDDANPMHRLWSDGRWLKAYAAHGCYWHNCAFCDTGLDYIRSYQPVKAEALFSHLLVQAEKTGVRGVHLVDEACPPASLLRLALLNRDAGLPLLFWGNIRFEKTFTPDIAAILAAGGIIGVSAGIEVASEKGFARIGKGLGLEEVTRACAAFKEAGILVHAYLIYGYWDEDDREIIDSAEILRQLFAEGLLDSAFWHQFILTKHSRIYAEWQRGLHPALHPSGDPLCSADNANGAKIFALNDLSFQGEERFRRWAVPLETLLSQWMAGSTATPVQNAFPFKVPAPSVAPDKIAAIIDDYARRRDQDRISVTRNESSARALFLGSRPIQRIPPPHKGKTGGEGRAAELYWRWRLSDCVLRAKKGTPQAPAAKNWPEQTAALLEQASAQNGMNAAEFFAVLETLFADNAGWIWKKLRQQGLAVY